MSSVYIGIRHDDYLVISQFINIEFRADTAAQSNYERRKLIVVVDLVLAGFLNVEHFPHIARMA